MEIDAAYFHDNIIKTIFGILKEFTMMHQGKALSFLILRLSQSLPALHSWTNLGCPQSSLVVGQYPGIWHKTNWKGTCRLKKQTHLNLFLETWQHKWLTAESLLSLVTPCSIHPPGTFFFLLSLTRHFNIHQFYRDSVADEAAAAHYWKCLLKVLHLYITLSP